MENITNTEKSMDGFYRLFDNFQRVTGTNFYDLAAPMTREKTTDLSSVQEDVRTVLSDLRERFLEAMDDDFNTGGAIGLLYEMRRAINGFINQNKLEESCSDEKKSQLTTITTLFKELANVVGVFRRPVEKSETADDEFVDGLMQLVLDIRQQARADKNWTVADKIRDALKELNVEVEDGKEGVRWSRS